MIEKTVKMIAPGDKIIVEIEKGADALAFDISEVTQGKILSAGDECTESVRNEEGSTVVFGKNRAQIPSVSEDICLLVMPEENILAIYSEVVG